ncbi:MAG: putative holin [Elusimicrobiales bacterium]
MPENKEPTAGAATGAQSPQDAVSEIRNMLGELLTAFGRENATGAGASPPPAASGSTAKVSLASRLTPRMLACLVLAGMLAAGVAVLSPAQLPVAAYKLCLVSIAGYLGYWLDRWCFPYARPDSFLVAADWRAEKQPAADAANHPVAPGCEQVYAAAMLRRALIMLGAMLAMGLGL